MKKLSESIWSDIHKRSNGKIVRKEDDINNYNIEELCEYLNSVYKSVDPDDDIFVDDDGDLDICLYADAFGHLQYLYYTGSKIIACNDVFEKLDCEREVRQKYWIQLHTNSFGFEEMCIYPKNQAVTSMSNEFFVEVLDFILDKVDNPLKKQIEKVI